MSEVYKIAVKLAMESNAHGVLALIAKDALGLHGSLDKIQSKLAGISKMKLAIGGGLAIAGGTAIFAGLDKIATHGVDLLDQQDKLIRAGRTHAEVAALTADAYERIAKAVPTATASDILRVTNQLAVVTGDLKAAEAATPAALKIEALLGNITGRSAEGSGHALWRAMEMHGLTSGDEANRAIGSRLMETLVQNIAASGGKLTAGDIQAMAKRGGAYWKKATPEFLAGPMSVFAADVGGDTAGTTMATFGQFLSGAGTMSKQQFEALRRVGMIDESHVTVDKGGRVNASAGAIRGGLEYQGDFYGWMQKELIPHMNAAGLKEGPERDSVMAKIGRNRNTLRMMTMFSDPEFVTQITKDFAIFRKALGLDASYASYTANDPKGVREAFDKQEESMLQAIGSPLMQAALPVMRGVTALFSDLGAFANAHGDTIKALGIGIAGLGAALIGGGSIAILAAIGPAGWLIGGVVALGAALTAARPGAMKEVARGIVTAWDGLAHLDFGKFVSGIGLELTGAFHLLPNMVSGAITGAVAGIAALFSKAISGLAGMISGAVTGIFKGIGGPATTPEGSGRLGVAPGAGGGRYHPSSYEGPGAMDRARNGIIPTRSASLQPINLKVELDGKTIAKSTTRHQVASMEFANAIGGHDSYGSHYPAGSTALGV